MQVKLARKIEASGLVWRHFDLFSQGYSVFSSWLDILLHVGATTATITKSQRDLLWHSLLLSSEGLLQAWLIKITQFQLIGGKPVGHFISL